MTTPKQDAAIAAYRAAQNAFELALQQRTTWPTDARDKAYNARTAKASHIAAHLPHFNDHNDAL